MLTYKQAFDKITEAYIKDELNPMNGEFCFCGTLAGGRRWRYGEGDYSPEEYGEMEGPLLRGLMADVHYYTVEGKYGIFMNKDKATEELVFKNMCNSLEVLKQIHVRRGENVEETPIFIKREKKEAINV